MKNEVGIEKCALCDKEIEVSKDTPIDLRKNYVEGAGQLCPACYNEIYDEREGSCNR